MKLHKMLLPFAASVAWTAAAQVSVPVANSGFEEDELFCGGCFYPAITGWSVGPNSGVQKTSTADFPGGRTESTLLTSVTHIQPGHSHRSSMLQFGPTPFIR
jgi:hypothetical protein